MIVTGMCVFLVAWAVAWWAYCRVRRARQVFESIRRWERTRVR